MGGLKKVCKHAKRGWLMNTSDKQTVPNEEYLLASLKGLEGAEEAVKKCLKRRNMTTTTMTMHTTMNMTTLRSLMMLWGESEGVQEGKMKLKEKAAVEWGKERGKENQRKEIIKKNQRKTKRGRTKEREKEENKRKEVIRENKRK